MHTFNNVGGKTWPPAGCFVAFLQTTDVHQQTCSRHSVHCFINHNWYYYTILLCNILFYIYSFIVCLFVSCSNYNLLRYYDYLFQLDHPQVFHTLYCTVYCNLILTDQMAEVTKSYCVSCHFGDWHKMGKSGMRNLFPNMKYDFWLFIYLFSQSKIRNSHCHWMQHKSLFTS